jgi:hypothetical protein
VELFYADPYYGTESEGTVDFIDELRTELVGFDEPFRRWAAKA